MFAAVLTDGQELPLLYFNVFGEVKKGKKSIKLLLTLGLVFVLPVLHNTSCRDMTEVGGAGGVVEMTLPGWKCDFLLYLFIPFHVCVCVCW